MVETCKNCNIATSGKYCSACGQRSNTHRINLSFIWHDIQHSLLHIDKGIFYTIKELFTRPGHSIREFIEGKRVNHFKPVSLVLVLAGVYGFLSHYYNINLLANKIEVNGTGEGAELMKEKVSHLSEWISQHYAMVALLQVPIFALSTFLAYKKQGYNFLEHIVIHCFLTGQRIFLHLLFFPIFMFFNGTEKLRIIERTVDIMGICLLVLSLLQFFSMLKWPARILRTALSLLFYFLMIYAVFSSVAQMLT